MPKSSETNGTKRCVWHVAGFTDCSKAVLLTWFSVLLVLVSVSVLFSPSMCLQDL